ncbi:hypothetical protein GOP47_0026316 [Adiantum capillus-veneris]|nr:hypothetical protein GOP47_0026316 [Adiantum capillus-veneris]
MAGHQACLHYLQGVNSSRHLANFYFSGGALSYRGRHFKWRGQGTPIHGMQQARKWKSWAGELFVFEPDEAFNYLKEELMKNLEEEKNKTLQLKDEKVVIEEEEDEEWKHIVSTKGKSKTTKELIFSRSVF